MYPDQRQRTLTAFEFRNPFSPKTPVSYYTSTFINVVSVSYLTAVPSEISTFRVHLTGTARRTARLHGIVLTFSRARRCFIIAGWLCDEISFIILRLTLTSYLLMINQRNAPRALNSSKIEKTCFSYDLFAMSLSIFAKDLTKLSSVRFEDV